MANGWLVVKVDGSTTYPFHPVNFGRRFSLFGYQGKNPKKWGNNCRVLSDCDLRHMLLCHCQYCRPRHGNRCLEKHHTLLLWWNFWQNLRTGRNQRSFRLLYKGTTRRVPMELGGAGWKQLADGVDERERLHQKNHQTKVSTIIPPKNMFNMSICQFWCLKKRYWEVFTFFSILFLAT